MAEEYDNGGKHERWMKSLQAARDELSSIINRQWDYSPRSETEERREAGEIADAIRSAERLLDSLLSEVK